MRLLALAATLVVACAGAPSPRPPGPAPATPAAGAADALWRFAAAAEAGRWEQAWPLLSARWRAGSTPGRLARDWKDSGPVGPEAAQRVLALLRAGAEPVVAGREATLAVAAGRKARLVAEADGWRVEALE